jgi:hypothetical protein
MKKQMKSKTTFLVFLLPTVLPGIYLGRNIPFTKGNEMNLTIDKICAEYFNLHLEGWKKRGGKIT